MAFRDPQDITSLLLSWQRGEPQALDSLLPVVYGELRALAAAQLRSERHDHTLGVSALVHEAYLRLIDQRRTRWRNRSHFFGVSARIMRRVLVDHARQKLCAKRGGLANRMTLAAELAPREERAREIVALDHALRALGREQPLLARIVELRFFAGLSMDEVGGVLALSPRTVRRRFATARAWLYREIEQGGRRGLGSGRPHAAAGSRRTTSGATRAAG